MTDAVTGLEEVRALVGREGQGIARALGFAVVEVDEGRAVLAGTPGPHVFNPLGIVHGGYAATLLDSACGLVVHAALPGDKGYATLEIKVSYLKGMTAAMGEVRCEGHIVSLGRRTAFTEATLKDAHGTLLATATSTLLIVDRPRTG